ncbi:MAG: hypothetical protein JXB15_02215 [Anaerolineales bacterium]|nr:hypothetical protein [Anaerolineales bacterium]
MFRRLFFLSVILSLAACAPARQTVSLPEPTSAPISQPTLQPDPTSTIASLPAPKPTKPAPETGEPSNTYWVTNPTSQAQLFVQVQYPDNWNGQALPTLVLVPGGTAAGDPQKARQLVDLGFIVIVFDADGRGHSQGVEDMNGYVHQDGLAAIIRSTLTIPGVDIQQIGLLSYSYGITMASGALARYPDLPVKFLIDWEGPANRFDTTVGCKPNPRNQWPDCADEAAWAQREAETFISQIRVPYQRVQSEIDHVQPDVSNAIDMINAAVQGGVPWVRLNDYPANQTYDINNPPAMIPEAQAKRMDAKIAQYAQELFALSISK